MGIESPSILLITCHDLGRFLGCYGVPTVHSPNLDRLASEGVLFDRAFCAAPQCSPSRASIFTGRYPHCNGVMGLTHGEFGWDLNLDERHLASRLRELGYHTAMVGIVHEARSIDRLGFSETHFPGHDARETTEIARSVLERAAYNGQPFYLQVGYHEPHRVGGHQSPDEQFLGFVGDYIPIDDTLGVTVPSYIHDDVYSRREIAELQGAVRHLDAAVGEFLDSVRELGLEDGAIVLFTTDHGVALPRAKCSLYDPGIEVALIVRWPAGGWVGGRRVSAIVSNIDVTPTILDACDVNPMHDERIQGRSLSGLLSGEAETFRDEIYAELTYHDYYHPQRAVRTERHKLIVNFTTAPAFMDPTQSWHRRIRPVVPEEPALAYGPTIELYDLAVDPLEWTNLADDSAHADTRSALLSLLFKWMRDTGDPLLDGPVVSPRHLRAIQALERSSGDTSAKLN